MPADPMTSDAPLRLLDYWRIVWRARWWLLLMTAAAMGVAFGVTRAQPKVYSARATILIPREIPGSSLSASLGAMLLGSAGGGRDGGGSGGGGLLSLPAVSLGVGGASTNQEAWVAMLKSRTLRSEVMAAVTRAWGGPVDALIVKADADIREKGTIGLTVDARDPQLAAEVANEYFVRLDAMLERLSDESLRKKEAVYAGQLDRAAREVEVAEQALLKFQAENRFIALDGPTRGQVEAVASLRATIMSLEMQREVMRLRVTEEHPQMRELNKQIAELKRQYSRNLFGEPMDLPPEGPATRTGRKEFFVAASKMTPVQFAFLKLFRNLKIQEAFYTGALQGLQQIKYGDGAYQQSVQFLDKAVPPKTHVWPKVPVVVGIAGACALVVGILATFVVEYVRRLREEESRARFPQRPRLPEPGGDGARVPTPETTAGVQPVGRVPGRPVRAARERVE
jgi:uncharacterized protein involved in exopolysaccharide biosynthesis